MKVVVIKFSDYSNFDQMLDWCEKQFGGRKEIHGVYQAEMYRWCYEIIGFGLKQIYFRDERDYLFFILKWGKGS